MVVDEPNKTENPPTTSQVGSRNFQSWKIFLNNKCKKTYDLGRTWFYRNWKYVAIAIVAAIAFYWTYRDSLSNEEEDDLVERRDVASSIASMEPLLRIEQALVQSLDIYATELQRKVDTIRGGLASMRRAHEIYGIDAEEFLGNPLNSFSMLRRLKTEWKAWEMFLKESTGEEQIEIMENIFNDIEDYDLLEAVNGVERLRLTYDIQPEDWANGQLLERKFDFNFTSLDCYAVAFLLFKQEKFESALGWFQTALNTYRDCDLYGFLNFNRSSIYEFYIDTLLQLNLTSKAQAISREALEYDPDNSKLQQRKILVENFNFTSPSEEVGEVETLTNDSVQGCRGDYEGNASESLFCYYNWSTNDFVRLAPFKVEELLLEPPIMLYHDVISDIEISIFRNKSKDLLRRSLVLDDTETEDIKSPLRTSKNAWLDDDYDPAAIRLNRRIEDMTGLYTVGTNLLIGNYGLGGHYSSHSDCIDICNENNDREETCDKRLATVLFYMSNVLMGGATAFPGLEIAVPPRKGTALLWYNINDRLECDDRTEHTGCPVLVGSKWFLIKWIYFKDQMLRKPCFDSDKF